VRCFTAQLANATLMINIGAWSALAVTCAFQPNVIRLSYSREPDVTVQQTAAAADCLITILAVFAALPFQKRLVSGLSTLPIFYLAFVTTGSTVFQKVHMLLDC
jgi:hypothetical protein